MAVSMVRGTAARIPVILEDQEGERISLKGMQRVEVYLRQREDDIFIQYSKDYGVDSDNIELGDGDDFTLILTADPDDLYAIRHGAVEIQVGWIDTDGKPQACVAATMTAEKLIKGGKIA